MIALVAGGIRQAADPENFHEKDRAIESPTAFAAAGALYERPSLRNQRNRDSHIPLLQFPSEWNGYAQECPDFPLLGTAAPRAAGLQRLYPRSREVYALGKHIAFLPMETPAI